MPFVSKKAIDALLFYACDETYKRHGIHPKGSRVRYAAAPIVNDHGARARAALADLERRSVLDRIRRLFRTERAEGGPRVVTTHDPLNPQPSLVLLPAAAADSNEA